MVALEIIIEALKTKLGLKKHTPSALLDTPPDTNLHPLTKEIVSREAAPLINILTQICGPYAKSVAVPMTHNGMQYSTFTKDGIDVLNSTRVDSQIGEFIRQTATYFGSRVDSIARDGTTTGMLLLLKLWSVLQDDPEQTTSLIKALSKVVDNVTIKIDDTNIEHKKYVAYHQAMISSKGDHELAWRIAEVVSTLPKELYGAYRIHHSPVESEEMYRLKHRDYDFEIRGFYDQQVNNANMKTECAYDSVYLFATATELVGNNPATMALINILQDIQNNVIVLDKPLVVVSPKIDAQLQGAISQYNRERTQPHPIIWFHMQGENIARNANLVQAIQVSSDYKDPFDVVTQSFKEVGHVFNLIDLTTVARIRMHSNHVCEISDLYVRGDGVFHPYYVDPDKSTAYTQFRKELEDTVNTLKSKVAFDSRDLANIETLNGIYRQLVCQNQVDLEICGSSFDNLANRSVAQDAYGAAIASIESGVVVGAFLTLTRYVLEMKEEFHLSDEVCDVFMDIVKTIYRPNEGQLQYLIDPTPLNPTRKLQEHYLVDANGEIIHSDFEPNKYLVYSKSYPYDYNAMQKEPVLIQPAIGYVTFVRRLREVLEKAVTGIGFLKM